jgi:hypothetical protein
MDSPRRRQLSRPDPVVGSCSGCPQRWDSPSAAHCATCHQTFPDVAGFDDHRAARACRGPGDSNAA